MAGSQRGPCVTSIKGSICQFQGGLLTICARISSRDVSEVLFIFERAHFGPMSPRSNNHAEWSHRCSS